MAGASRRRGPSRLADHELASDQVLVKRARLPSQPLDQHLRCNPAGLERGPLDTGQRRGEHLRELRGDDRDDREVVGHVPAALAQCAGKEADEIAALKRTGPVYPYQAAEVHDAIVHQARLAAVEARAKGCA